MFASFRFFGKSSANSFLDAFSVKISSKSSIVYGHTWIVASTEQLPIETLLRKQFVIILINVGTEEGVRDTFKGLIIREINSLMALL